MNEIEISDYESEVQENVVKDKARNIYFNIQDIFKSPIPVEGRRQQDLAQKKACRWCPALDTERWTIIHIPRSITGFGGTQKGCVFG